MNAGRRFGTPRRICWNASFQLWRRKPLEPRPGAVLVCMAPTRSTSSSRSWALRLSIVPESEIGHLVDTLEWVSNPDTLGDRTLLAHDATCLVYQVTSLAQRSWTSIVAPLRAVTLPFHTCFVFSQCAM